MAIRSFAFYRSTDCLFWADSASDVRPLGELRAPVQAAALGPADQVEADCVAFSALAGM